MEDCSEPRLDISRMKKKKNFQFLLRGIGISQIVLGGMMAAAAIVLLFVQDSWYYYNYRMPPATGIWCSIFVLPTAVLTLIASKKLTRCLVTWTFASSLLSVIFMVVAIILSADSGIQSNNHWRPAPTVMNIVICALAVPQIVMALYITATFGRMICSSQYEISATDMFGSCNCCKVIGTNQHQPYRGLVNAGGQIV